MKRFFTADFHFNHGNTIKLSKRPFKTLDEMNETIIKNYNDRVRPEDEVFFLGDFLFRNSPGGKPGEGLPTKAEDFIKRLNGRIVFIKGNHDRNNSLKTVIEKVYIFYGGKRICMVHNPQHADLTCELNFCGHVHGKYKFKKLNDRSYVINTGVDQWGFKPVTFEEIMKSFSQWRKGFEGVKHEKTSTNRNENHSKAEKSGMESP